MSSNESPLLSLNNVSVEFNQDDTITSRLLSDFGFKEPNVLRAVKNVSLDIYQNDVVALVGESGCGKTTLGKTAIGLQQPSSGSVKYRGQDIWEAKYGHGSIPFSRIRRELQIVHQDPGSALDPTRIVIDQLSEVLKKWESDLNIRERRSIILSMIERVGITPAENYGNRYPHQLSGGEKQRIALVRSFLLQPDLILLDEPISALDVSLRIDMMDMMLKLQKEFDTSYLFISHDLSNARYLTEHTDGRIGIMYLGQIVELAPVREILENPQHPYTKSLIWSTPALKDYKEEVPEPPLRKIDIPDASDSPSGCAFHPRCPEARDTCVQRSPELLPVDEDDSHLAACFDANDDSEYVQSSSVE